VKNQMYQDHVRDLEIKTQPLRSLDSLIIINVYFPVSDTFSCYVEVAEKFTCTAVELVSLTLLKQLLMIKDEARSATAGQDDEPVGNCCAVFVTVAHCCAC